MYEYHVDDLSNEHDKNDNAIFGGYQWAQKRNKLAYCIDRQGQVYFLTIYVSQ